MHRSTKTLIACVSPMAIFLTGAALLCAQEFRATLSGRVTDPSGAVVPHAQVEAVNLDTQQSYTTTTTGNGDYFIPYMLPGTYTVTVKAPGFQTKVQDSVLLETNKSIGLDLKLDVGSPSQTVEVTTAAPLLEAATGSNNTILTQRELENSPLDGRQVYTLISTTPGSQFLQQQFGPGGFSGTRGWDNANNYILGGGVAGYQQFMLNGTNITVQTSYQNQGQGAWELAPNIDALQEVNIMTSTYDARYGRTGGGTVNMVVKSGTNAYHGTMYDYFENGHLNANTFQSNLNGFPRSMVHQNQFGGTFGGPVKKKKIFFFGSFEGYREQIPYTTVASVPPAYLHPQAGKGVDFTQSGFTIFDPATTACVAPGGTLDNCPGSVFTRTPFPNNTIPAGRISAIGAAILNLYPAPNVVNGGISQNFIRNSPDVYIYNQPMVRVDYDTSDKTRWYSLFAYQHGTEDRNTNGLPPPLETGNIDHIRQNVTASQDLTHIFSPTMVVDFKLSFSRFMDFSHNGDLLTKPIDPGTVGLTMPLVPTTSLKTLPEISLSNFTGAGGNNNVDDVWNNIVFDADFTKTITHHTIHFGGQIGEYQFADPTTVGRPNGTFGFNGQFTRQNPNVAGQNQGLSVADLLLGYPNTGSVDWSSSIFDHYPAWALYVQDDWKATSRLTLNIGLRYDVQIGTKERHNQLNRGLCLTCVNPITNDPVFQANLAKDAPALRAAGIDPATLSTVYGGILFAGANGQPANAYDTDWTNIEPRFGLAYRLNDKTVIRGGYGIQFAIGLEGGSSTGYSVSTPYIASNNSNVTPANYFASGTPYPFGVQPALGASQGLSTAVGNVAQIDFPQRRIPRSEILSLGFQRELPGHMVLDARYAANFTDRLRAFVWVNGTMPLSQYQQAIANPNYFNQQVPNPYFGVINPSATMGRPTVPAQNLLTPFSQFLRVGEFDDPLGHQWYNALEVKLQKRFSQGLSFQLSYTYSKTLAATGYVNGWPYQDTDLKYQISGNDRTHYLALTGQYDLPVGKDKYFLSNPGKVVGEAINGWRLSWVFRTATGFPASLNQGYNYTCTHSYTPDGGPTLKQYYYYQNGTPSSCWQPLAQFVLPYLPSRISTLRAPYIPNLDLSLQKNFAIKENWRLQFRADAFNLTNSVLFGGPDSNPGNRVQVSANGVYSGFGTVGITQLNFPRIVQLALKVLF